MVTGHGYLHGTQPRDMRMHLSETFDRCYCLDLHGSVRRTSTAEINDEPVFQIMTGVAIAVAFRTWKHPSRGMTCVSSITGTLGLKLALLSDVTALHTRFETALHCPTSPYFYFEQSETEFHIADEYSQFLDLPQLFGRGKRDVDKEVYWATGSASQQNDLAISFSATEMESKITALANSRSVDDLRQRYRLCTTDQWDYLEAKRFAQSDLWRQHFGRIAYRAFDRRWTIFHKNVLTKPWPCDFTCSE